MTQSARLPDLRPGQPPFLVDDEAHRALALKLIGDAIGQAESGIPFDRLTSEAAIRDFEKQRQAVIDAPVRTL